MKIYNVKERALPDSTMYVEELEATLAVARHLISEDNGKCSFVLRGHADGELSKDLLRFDASDGTSTPFAILHRKVDHLIEQFEYDATRPEIIHRPNNTAVLILPTTYGSFICSASTLKKSSVDVVKLLMAIARALYRLSESDTVLKASYDIITWEKGLNAPGIERCVDNLFEADGVEEIESWKYWRKANDDLGLFFNEG